MTVYEGMFIFPDRFREEELDGVIKRVRGEIEGLGGEIWSATRLGRRQFARPMKKTEHGHYAVVTFAIEAGQIPALRGRLKLNEDVLRVQFVRTGTGEAAARA